MIPTKTLITINDLLWEGTPDSPISINYDDPRWTEVRLEVAMSCYKGNCRKMLNILEGRAGKVEVRSDFLHEIELELNELENLIHEDSARILERQGKRYTNTLKGKIQSELRRMRVGLI